MSLSLEQQKFMQYALDLAQQGMESGKGGPFGCVVVKDGQIIGEGSNSVTSTTDPTAHAEVVAIREACKHLNDFQLNGCDIYTSCEPCPMCLGAIYWARPDRVYFANDKFDAAQAGFDDAFIYEQLEVEPSSRSIPMIKVTMDDANKAFNLWQEKNDKTIY
ncbi:nucleoside deaminase [Litoribacter populi]|uniref:nucleoside deaminase n=1 Tax=Litoribacter populi TaxID=2598460 RepID=UPI001F23D880|nr:nucleoside deaminase [Litoribacter populi]